MTISICGGIVAIVAIVAVVVAVINNNKGGQPSGTDSSQVETSNNGNSAIVGKWKYDHPSLGDSFVYTFNSDGTGNYTASGDFTYKIDGNNIAITYNASGATFETEFEINGDTLNVKDSAGNDTFYKKSN